MSWYLANEKGIIDQVASGQGLQMLRAEAKEFPALKDFFTNGATKRVTACKNELYQLYKKSSDQDVKDTAKNLATLMSGQSLVSLTQGMGTAPAGDPADGDKKVKESLGEDDDEEEEEGTSLLENLRHPNHADRITPIKKRVKSLMARYFRRQKIAILQDIHLRFHISEMPVREADGKVDGEKRAEQLLPESLSPLNFLATPKEAGDYLIQIRRAIKSAAEQLASEVEAAGTIGENTVTTYLADNSLGKLTGELSEATKNRLRSAIANAVDASGTADDIVAAIKDTMADFSDQRAELIAQSEVNSAYNFGRHAMADAIGLTEKQWITESGNPCQICEDNESQGWIDITELFTSGDLFPIAHPMCYCSCDYRLVTAGEGL